MLLYIQWKIKKLKYTFNETFQIALKTSEKEGLFFMGLQKKINH